MSVAVFWWGGTPVLQPTSTSACSDRDIEERVLEDPRRQSAA
jgi:hypothetical protein